MPKLIINADDFGLSPGICKAIVDCSQVCDGLSTSVMTCVPRSRELASRYLKDFRGCIGVHLQLSEGTPVLESHEVPSLVGPEGRFARDEQRDEESPTFAGEVQSEWAAQVRRLRSWGVDANHIDTHQNMHSLPTLWASYTAIAQEFSLKARGGVPKLTTFLRHQQIAGPDISMRFWRLEPSLNALCKELDGYLQLARSEELVRQLPCAIEELSVEVVCHPALPEARSSQSPSREERREREFEIFSDEKTYRRIRELGWDLVRYDSLKLTA